MLQSKSKKLQKRIFYKMSRMHCSACSSTETYTEVVKVQNHIAAILFSLLYLIINVSSDIEMKCMIW